MKKKLLALGCGLLLLAGCSIAPHHTTPAISARISAPQSGQNAASEGTPSAPVLKGPLFTAGSGPYQPPAGTVQTVDSTAADEIHLYWQKAYPLAQNPPDFAFYDANDPISEDASEETALLQKYGANLYLKGLKETSYVVQWESAYALIGYYGVPSAKEQAVPLLWELEKTSPSKNVRDASTFTLDVLQGTFSSPHISASSDRKTLAFADHFEATLGGGSRLWTIRDGNLYLDTLRVDGYTSSVTQATVSPNGKYVAVNLEGRKGSWGFVITLGQPDTLSGDLIDAMAAPLQQKGYVLFREGAPDNPDWHGVYYSNINALSWTATGTLKLDVNMQIVDHPDPSALEGTSSLTGTVLYHPADGTFDFSGLTRSAGIR